MGKLIYKIVRMGKAPKVSVRRHSAVIHAERDPDDQGCQMDWVSRLDDDSIQEAKELLHKSMAAARETSVPFSVAAARARAKATAEAKNVRKRVSTPKSDLERMVEARMAGMFE